MSRILFETFFELVPPDPPVHAPSISFDPPGGIGLDDDEAVVLLRFDEAETAIRPKDAAGGLQDLGIITGLAQSIVTAAAMGNGRFFNAGITSGFVAQDIVPGSTLLTRDMSVQFIASFNMANQIAYGTPGVVCNRGKGANWGASEISSWSVISSHVGVAAGNCMLAWEWETVAGALKTQVGVEFTPPAPGLFTLITLTRRWVSPTQVVLRYYAGDVLLREVTSSDGDIGGATTGTTGVGSVGQYGGSGYGRTFAGGILDELMVVPRELTFEEVEFTWQRISKWQPLGVQLFREMHDPGFPLPTDPGTEAQRDTRFIGTALGYAAAQAENLRANALPGRAYGKTLEDWETALRVTPQPSQSIDERRARAVARLRQHRGCTVPGFGDALVGLLGGADVGQLEFLAFSNEIDDAFTTIDPLRWDVLPNGGGGIIMAVAGAASFQPGAGSFFMDGATWPPSWITMRQTVGGDGIQAHHLAKLVWTTPQANAEAGIYVENATTKDYLLLGLRDLAGSFRVETESFIAGVSQGVVQQAIIGANPAAIWLHLYQTADDSLVPAGMTRWRAAWSTTSATTGFTTSADIVHPKIAHWSGCYLRSISALGAGPRADFDDHRLYMPFCNRPLNGYILLDRALGFLPDMDGANSVIFAIKHAFTHGAFITNRVFLAGDPDSGAGLAPTGGY